MTYVFDTNSLRVASNYYPEQFPTFWMQFDSAIAAAEVISVREVLNELDRWNTVDWFAEWMKKNKPFFLLPTSEELEFVAEIFDVSHFQSLIGKKQALAGLPVADPFLIASARVRNGCVVTEEALKPNAAKIPNVCEYFSVDCTNLQGFLKRQGWSF